MEQFVVAYVPTPLRSMREICETLGVGETVVKRWVAEGAPIAVEGDRANTRYSAELARLQDWRLNKSQCRFTEEAVRQV